jgi:hypothetical protein
MNNILQVWKVNNYGKGVIDGSQDFYRITPDASGVTPTVPTLQEVLQQGNDSEDIGIVIFTDSGNNGTNITPSLIEIYDVNNQAEIIPSRISFIDIITSNGLAVDSEKIIKGDGVDETKITFETSTDGSGTFKIPNLEGEEETAATREWVQANAPSGAVDSVNGQTGVVVLDAADVGAEPTLGFTPENVTNKATNLTTPDNTKYPTTQAVANGLALNVAKADYAPAHSVLAQQSGTGSPTAVTIGTNEILGRLSGGGGDIKGLTTSETRTLLSINNVDNTSDANKPISTATQTALDLKSNLNRVEQIIDSKADGVFGSVTGTTAETVAIAIDISANEYEAGDRLSIKVFTDKDGGSENVQYRIRVGTTGTTSDSLIATTANFVGNNARYMFFSRERLLFLTGDTLRVPAITVATSVDTGGLTGASGSVSLTPSSAWKITITAQLSAGAETTNIVGYTISKIKST